MANEIIIISSSEDESDSVKSTSQYEHYSVNKILSTLNSKESIYNWCVNHNLITKKILCEKCNGQLKVYFNSHGLGMYKCKCKYKVSIANNSLFRNEKLSPVKIILLMYFFIFDTKYTDIKRECADKTVLSSSTISKWFKFFRKCCKFQMDLKEKEQGLIGGLNKIVEIDETWISERKYRRGRNVKGQWILGIIERKSANYRLEMIQNKRSAHELTKMVRKHVHPDSTIITDNWRGYSRLNEHFKRHQTVNHSKNFISPKTGAHTQKIESNWRNLKQNLSKKRDRRHLNWHLSEYLYKRNLRLLYGDSMFDKFACDVGLSFNRMEATN